VRAFNKKKTPKRDGGAKGERTNQSKKVQKRSANILEGKEVWREKSENAALS